jgi:hypothetical protein
LQDTAFGGSGNPVLPIINTHVPHDPFYEMKIYTPEDSSIKWHIYASIACSRYSTTHHFLKTRNEDPSSQLVATPHMEELPFIPMVRQGITLGVPTN